MKMFKIRSIPENIVPSLQRSKKDLGSSGLISDQILLTFNKQKNIILFFPFSFEV